MPFLLEGKIRDISNKGAYLLLPMEFRVGQRVRLEMHVPPEAARSLGLGIQCEAEVIRVDPPAPGGQGRGVAVRILSFQTPEIFPGGSSANWQ